VHFKNCPVVCGDTRFLGVSAALAAPVQRLCVNKQFDAFIDIRDGFARLIAIKDEFEPGYFSLNTCRELP